MQAPCLVVGTLTEGGSDSGPLCSPTGAISELREPHEAPSHEIGWTEIVAPFYRQEFKAQWPTDSLKLTQSAVALRGEPSVIHPAVPSVGWGRGPWHVSQPPCFPLSLQGEQRPWFQGLHADSFRHPRQSTPFMSHGQLFQALLGLASHLTFKTRLWAASSHFTGEKNCSSPSLHDGLNHRVTLRMLKEYLGIWVGVWMSQTCRWVGEWGMDGWSIWPTDGLPWVYFKGAEKEDEGWLLIVIVSLFSEKSTS